MPACRGRVDAHWERFAGVRDAETTSDYAVLLACEVLGKYVLCGGLTEMRRAEIMRSGMYYRDAQI